MQDRAAEKLSSEPDFTASTTAPALEYPKESIVSHAQTHEDVLLWRALHTIQPGFYVDIGAHDPVVLSVTKAFYDRGWSGINVEPLPMRAAKLRKERPRDETFEVALGQIPGVATIYDFGDTGLSTLVSGIADAHAAAGFEPTELRVPVTTLAALLDNLEEREVHFLKIDVEGYERQVLAGANFQKVRPWIVLVEAVEPRTAIPAHEVWEPILLEAGYIFAYFDGLNRFYVAQEHLELKRVFSAPVSIMDPYHDSENMQLSAAVATLEKDKVTRAELVTSLSGLLVDLEQGRIAQATETERLRKLVAQLEGDKEALAKQIAHLSATISELEVRNTQHEVPQLVCQSSTPIVCQAHDARGLLRIVEVQASELVRLRRALLSVQTIASQRAELIRNMEEQFFQNAQSSSVIASETISGWLRPIITNEIGQVQNAISDVVELSRWRQFGQRLGLAKRTGWERGDWRSSLIASCPTAGSPSEVPPISDLRNELARLYGFLAEMRSSRWRKLGQWLGLAKRLSWETGANRALLLTEDFPQEETAPQVPRKAMAAQATYKDKSESIVQRFLLECRSHATDVVLDVGANIGQFSRSFRAAGYDGHLISFEPHSEAHAELAASAASDALWDVVDKCAVGSEDGWAEINISANSYSSSLLPMLDLHRDAAPKSDYKGTERCRVVSLDTYIAQTFSDPTTSIGIKIDTQGYEARVLAGLRKNIDRVKVLQCEMSLAPLYADAPDISELCRILAKLGFHCVALSPGFEHRKTGELLQVDGVFAKRD